jgi:hypothetical protein
MKYPEMFFMPILMFFDYFLTVLAAVQKEKKYSRHFKTRHYELNPKWQKSISKRQWINPRHILLTLIVTTLLVVAVEYIDFSADMVAVVEGCLFVVFGLVIGRHISNLLIFWHVGRKPEDLSGEVEIGHAMSLYFSLFQYIGFLFPMTLILAFTKSPFSFGGLLGVMILAIVHLKWIKRNNKG